MTSFFSWLVEKAFRPTQTPLFVTAPSLTTIHEESEQDIDEFNQLQTDSLAKFVHPVHPIHPETTENVFYHAV